MRKSKNYVLILIKFISSHAICPAKTPDSTRYLYNNNLPEVKVKVNQYETKYMYLLKTGKASIGNGTLLFLTFTTRGTHPTGMRFC